MNVLDEKAHIVAAPILDGAEACAILAVGLLVGNLGACLGVGIEIVVDVQSVNVVAADDVAHHLADVFAVLRYSGIEEQQLAILEEALRMLEIGVGGGQHGGACRLGAVGVYPSVELHAAAVALVNHPLEGVPVGLGCHALLTGEKSAPGLQLAGVEGVALSPDLEEDGIDMAALQGIEMPPQGGLHPVAAQGLELSVNTLDPAAPELSLGLRGL